MKWSLIISLLLPVTGSYAQVAVDKTGNCGGKSPCYTSIQQGINVAAAGQVVKVYPGDYIENITISKAITLQSAFGPAKTRITGIGPGDYTAPVMIQGPVSNVVIGGSAGHGFTILGIDNTQAGNEAAAVLLGDNSFAPVSNVTISYNTITAAGEAGLLTRYHYPDYISGLSIHNNIFNGKTFAGTEPADGNTFENLNSPKSAIVLYPGIANAAISNNIICTVTGAAMSGNAIIYLGSRHSSVMLNEIVAHTGGYKGAINVKGAIASIACNRLNMADIGTSADGSNIISGSGNSAYTVEAVAKENTFLPAGYISDNAIVTAATEYAANKEYPAAGCTMLPLNLNNFNAEFKGNGIKLTWQTVNEAGGNNYIIEQSSDDTIYTAVTNVASQGNGNFNYCANIFPQAEGTVFIRLKQVDMDGRYLLSRVIGVNTGSKTTLQVLNNPAKGQLFLSGMRGKTVFSIYNSAGEVAAQKITGETSDSIDISQMESGPYLLTAVDDANKMTTLKILVQ